MFFLLSFHDGILLNFTGFIVLFVAYKQIYYFNERHPDCVNCGVWVPFFIVGSRENGSRKNHIIIKKEVGMHMKRVFVKALSIAKCVLNAALAFALMLSL